MAETYPNLAKGWLSRSVALAPNAGGNIPAVGEIKVFNAEEEMRYFVVFGSFVFR